MILIDTHVWIWFHSAQERLSKSAIERLKTEDQVAMSTVSIYETMVAVAKGRITTVLDPEALVRRWLSSSSVVRIPVTEEIVIKSQILDFKHSDPFDRIIAATAVQAKAPLMTADGHLLGLAWLTSVQAS